MEIKHVPAKQITVPIPAKTQTTYEPAYFECTDGTKFTVQKISSYEDGTPKAKHQAEQHQKKVDFRAKYKDNLITDVEALKKLFVIGGDNEREVYIITTQDYSSLINEFNNAYEQPHSWYKAVPNYTHKAGTFVLVWEHFDEGDYPYATNYMESLDELVMSWEVQKGIVEKFFNRHRQ